MWRHLSLRRKLTAIILVASSAALLVACSVVLIYDTVTFRQALVEDVETLSALIAANSTAALAFQDRRAAREVLATLAAEKNLIEAAIFDRSGRPFARFQRQPETAPTLLLREAPGHAFEGDSLVLHDAIQLDGERIGSVALRSDLGRLRARIAGFGGLVVLALAVSLVLTFVLSAPLQRVVSGPILQLVATTRRVAEEKDFSVRAAKTSDDELGLLVDTFNEMIGEVEHRDRDLRRYLQRIEEARGTLLARSREVQRVNRELARSNRELEDFAFVASHDLQEPLRKVTAFGDRLESRDGAALSEDGRDYLQRMRGAAERMQSLIDDLLTYSRVTTRAQPFVPVDLGELVGEVLSDLEVRLESTGARLEVGELPTLVADRLQVRQLLQNLLSNALKFRRPGVRPEIRVDAERFDEATPADGGETPAPRYRITVADNGIGFDEKYLDRLFKPFHRLHGRSAYEGTGIGLAICKKIVDRHGGEITARSTPGAGATFAVTVPADPTAPEDTSTQIDPIRPEEELA